MVSAFHAAIPRKEHIEGFGLEASISFNKGFSKQECKSAKGKLAEGCELDETEDEEVKVNCVGRANNVYTTTSEEEDSEDDGESTIYEESEEDIDEFEAPAFITCKVPRNTKIHRPRPILGALIEGGDSDSDSFVVDDTTKPLHLQKHHSNLDVEDDGDADDEQSTELVRTSDSICSLEQKKSVSDDIRSERCNGTDCKGGQTADLCEGLRISKNDESVCEDPQQHIDGCMSACTSNRSTTCGEEIHKQELYPELRQTFLPGKAKRYISSIFTNEDRSNQKDVSDRQDASKRIKCSKTPSEVDSLPEFLLIGPSLYGHFIKLRDSAVSPFSVYNSERDKQLSEELLESDCILNRESTPVPLLSPPPSPLCVNSEGGTLGKGCDWSNNLGFENALTIVTGARSYSSPSLLKMKEDEEDRIMPYQSIDAGTTLTPLIKGISVGL